MWRARSQPNPSIRRHCSLSRTRASADPLNCGHFTRRAALVKCCAFVIRPARSVSCYVTRDRPTIRDGSSPKLKCRSVTDSWQDRGFPPGLDPPINRFPLRFSESRNSNRGHNIVSRRGVFEQIGDVLALLRAQPFGLRPRARSDVEPHNLRTICGGVVGGLTPAGEPSRAR